MVQITWVPEQAATTATPSNTATTGYAQILPSWAPAIAALPTTTSVTWQPYIKVGATTTWGKGPGRVFTTKAVCWRNKGGRSYVGFARETGTATEITLAYRAVGELVRS